MKDSEWTSTTLVPRQTALEISGEGHRANQHEED